MPDAPPVAVSRVGRDADRDQEILEDRNHVKDGWLQAPEQWPWSSYRSYANGEEGLVRINQLSVRAPRSDTLAMNSEMSNVKQQVESLLNKLPENCSIEDIQYHLYVLDKVRHGLEDAKAQGTLSQDDVETRLSQWL